MRPIRSRSTCPRRRAVVASLAGSVVAAFVLSVTPAVMAVAAPLPSESMTLAAGSMPMALVHTARISGGDVSTTWKANSGEVKVAGMTGSKVVLGRTGKDSAEVRVEPSAAAGVSAAQYARSGRSVYWDALGAGMTKAEAVKMTLAMGDRIPAAAHVAAIPKRFTADVFNSVCATAAGGAYDAVQGSACLQQSYLETKPGKYYLENQITTTGFDDLGGGGLTALEGNYCWCNNGYTYTRVGWSPSSTISEGSPTTYTLTASGAGFSGSVQETQYPQTLSPLFPSGLGQPAFGSEWRGNVDINDISANSVAIVHEGPGAPGPATVVVWFSWVT
jgi:hypothetical protein